MSTSSLETDGSKEALTQHFTVSPQLQDALIEAVQSMPPGRQILEDVDLIQAIARGESAGGQILQNLMSGDINKLIGRLTEEQANNLPPSNAGLLRFETGSVWVGMSLKTLLDAGKKLAEGKPVTTAHMVMAETTDPMSILLRAVGRQHAVDNIHDHYERAANIPERGSVPLIFENIPQTLPVEPARQVVEHTATQVEVAKTVLFEAPSLTHDLLEQARQGEYWDIFLREKWVKQLLQSMDQHSLAVMVTDKPQEADEVMMGLAQTLSERSEGIFNYKHIIGVDPAAMEEDPAKTILAAVSSAAGGILYLPNIERYLDPKGDRFQAAGPLRVAMARRLVKVVSTSRERQWKTSPKDIGYYSPEPIYLDPLTVEETTEMLKKEKPRLERFLSQGTIALKITDAALEEAAKLSNRYYREGGAWALIQHAGFEIRFAKGDYKDFEDGGFNADGQVDVDDIRRALKVLTDIDVTDDSPEQYLEMDDKLNQRVVGQDEAIEAVTEEIQQAKAGFKNPKRPIGTFMFMGPSGVGKTELSLGLADFLFGSEDEVVRLNMSEYMEKHTVSRLIGAPPGYVGYEEGGQLTEAVRQKPYRVVLFDEIEKAHPEVLNILLQIMDTGTLTDGMGRVVDFRNTVIILTGNVGSEFYAYEGTPKKDGGGVYTSDDIKKIVEATVRDPQTGFRPELLGRVDHLIIFNSLNNDSLRKIVDIQIRKFNKMLNDDGVSVELTKEAREYLIQEGYSPAYGAREVEKVVRKYIGTAFTRMKLSRELTSGDAYIASYETVKEMQGGEEKEVKKFVVKKKDQTNENPISMS